MNQRQIDAAYDRLFESPPDVTDGWPEGDEMDLADIHKQEQIDKQDWLAERHRQKQEEN